MRVLAVIGVIAVLYVLYGIYFLLDRNPIPEECELDGTCAVVSDAATTTAPVELP